MAKHAEEIEKMMQISFQSSMDNVPQEMRHIILLYHECVIVATRPLLLSVLKERLEKLGRAEEDWQKFLALPKSLISIGIKSAEKTLQILSDENGHLETFLPFDLEFTYAAALHLTMANTLYPPGTNDDTYSKSAHSILDEMILCGNKVAEVRKDELRCIEGLFQEFAKRVQQEGLQVLTLSGRGLVEAGPDENPSQECRGQTPATEPPTFTESSAQSPSVNQSLTASVDPLDNVIGISSYEFLSIVDQIGGSEMPYVLNGVQTLMGRLLKQPWSRRFRVLLLQDGAQQLYHLVEAPIDCKVLGVYHLQTPEASQSKQHRLLDIGPVSSGLVWNLKDSSCSHKWISPQ
ncbi:hypothetical protein APSETT444_005969 [Aspergillus pseudonomiae]